jgi:hypothetical protein
MYIVYINLNILLGKALITWLLATIIRFHNPTNPKHAHARTHTHKYKKKAKIIYAHLIQKMAKNVVQKVSKNNE